MTAAELAATGAAAIFWFQGLSAGYSVWPTSVGTVRSSKTSKRIAARLIVRFDCHQRLSRRRKFVLTSINAILSFLGPVAISDPPDDNNEMMIKDERKLRFRRLTRRT